MRTAPGPAPTATRSGELSDLDPALRRAIETAAATPRLLVATAYNGTLAEVGDHPLARPIPAAVRPLRALTTLPATTAAVISGHALRDLAVLSRLPEEVRLIGSHGWESAVEIAYRLDAAAQRRLERLVMELRSLANAAPGTVLELKPASVGIHLGTAAPEHAAWVRERVRGGPAHLSGVHLREDRDTVEVSVVAVDKGSALDALRAEVDATAIVYLGDDVGDEAAFERLGAGDVGVRVGSGESHAEHRIAGPAAVPAVLDAVLSARQAHRPN